MGYSLKLNEGSEMPRGYGLAFYYVNRDQAVVFPIPFNYVVGWGYRLWMKFKVGPTTWQHAYDKGYHQGLEEGQDFGKIIAYNKTLTEEIPGIISRYSQLQVKLIHKPKSEMQRALAEFTNTELDRFKMEMQNR